MTTACPHSAHGRRKTVREGERTARGVEVIDGVWHISELPLVKEVLRAGNTTVQAGFNSDMVHAEGERAFKDPILFMDGPEHRRQRSMIARYFAPATVSRRYRDLMIERADALVAGIAADLDKGRTVDLDDLSLLYSVEVAAKVIGLTNSRPEHLARRLERVFTVPAQMPQSHTDEETEPAPSLKNRFLQFSNTARALPAVGIFFVWDVRPAVVARRRERDEDVISHLIDQGYSDGEILSECLTYGAAGMVTTREYISVVTWHLLEDGDLRRTYLAAEEAERYDILHEILRLEPVVGSLYRRATEDMTLLEGDVEHHIPAGAVMALSIRGANADPEQVGADPLGLCPGRDLAKGVKPEAMSFGDGNHRCPGNALAIQETDILLTRLLRLPLTLAHAPTIDWLDLIAGYEIRGVRLAHA
ncbi:MAG: cytochrome P450 [Mobilicoccus sp.]|nr:cytochrome P450 [Mobilicoccus sp.]